MRCLKFSKCSKILVELMFSTQIQTLIQVCRIPRWCPLFLLSTGYKFLGEFGPKYQNYQVELKFGN